MFDAHIDTLLDIPVAHTLVDNHTDGALGDVINDSCLAMVDLMWHAGGRVSEGRGDHSGLWLCQPSQNLLTLFEPRHWP